MSKFNPRNRNKPTREAPKSTARWFDDQADARKRPRSTCGFYVPAKCEEPTP